MESFNAFWAAYPRKVGKLAAMAEFQKALRISPVEDILAGVERYIASKPVYADWCHPKTWLHQGRWMDEPDARVEVRSPGGISYECPHSPKCEKRWDCGMKQRQERYAS
jgi:hypothetical protein